MSDTFRNIVDVLLVAALAFFIWLAGANARIADSLLWPQRVEFECVKPEEARQMKARCVVIEARAIQAGVRGEHPSPVARRSIRTSHQH